MKNTPANNTKKQNRASKRSGVREQRLARQPKKKVERTTTVIPGGERTIKLPSGGTMRIAVGTVTMTVERT